MRVCCSPGLIAAILLALTACGAPRGPSPSPRTAEGAATGWIGADSIERPMVRSWPVMGAILQVSAWDGDTARALAAMEAARAAVLRVDSLMSVDRAGSEVSALNRRAGTDSATALSPWTAEVLESSLSITAALGGAGGVDGGGRQVRFDRATRRTWLPGRGMRLDLGGIAKGFAIDRARDVLRAAGVRRAVVDLGGSFAVLGAAPVGPRWSVALENPFAPGEVFAAVQLDSGAAATVGDSAVSGARTYQPAHDLASVSVIAPNAVLAAALSRAFFMMGPEAGCRLAARYPGVDAIWVRDPGAEEREEAERDADDGVDPRLVVITDALADRLELLSEEPAKEQSTRCSELVRRQDRRRR
ncbi:MAG TPA: FAD:protein FMN transferase [Longimicrobium sp.]|jgi:thiamine biosynthesis lipoprotein|nr:FAD:protein FMN transferase [Longimicrobium sp.]